jgi:hypothetical protein
MWLVATDPTSQLERAPVLPRVTQPRTLPPSSRGLRCCRTSRGSGSRLPTWEGSGATTCSMALSRLWDMRINKNNPGHAARVTRYRG